MSQLISSLAEQAQQQINNDVVVVRMESHCSSRGFLSNEIYVYAQMVVLFIQYAPTIVGPFTCELVVLYTSLCRLPQYIIYYLLANAIHELRPYNCGNEHYDSDYASPCVETLYVWSMVGFMFVHAAFRNSSEGIEITKINIHKAGYTIILASIFVTCTVVLTHNNTWEQSLLGCVVGLTFGVGEAIYLEFYFSRAIPYLLQTRLLKWLGYKDSVYMKQDSCDCVVAEGSLCRHAVGRGFHRFMTSMCD